MSNELQNAPTLEMQLETPALFSSAIVRCIDAMRSAAREAMQDLASLDPEGPSKFKDQAGELDGQRIGIQLDYAGKVSGEAYRETMPPLVGARNIRDFIACVAHGMLLHVFEANEGSKLLYASQVAAQSEAKRDKHSAF
jgi:hypothetical protein